MGGGRVLVAGGTGRAGRHVVRRLVDAGVAVRILTRDPAHAADDRVEIARGDLARKSSIAGLCNGCEAVVSCAGASLDPRALRDRRRYAMVDFTGNVNLLADAERAGCRRFVYVGVFSNDAIAGTAYGASHERFAELLMASRGVEGAVVRPTGFFDTFREYLSMAGNGRGFVIGDGSARTNPIHEDDVAALCVAALEGEPGVVDAGGPETFTREEIARMAFEALGCEPRLTHVAPRLLRIGAAAAGLLNARVEELLRFAIAASITDVVAPVRGAQRLGDYFADAASARPETVRAPP